MKSREWLDHFHLPYEVRTFGRITQEDFYKMLSLTEKGVEDILLPQRKTEKFKEIEQLTLKELWTFIREHPEFFKSPLMFNERKLLIGYNEENIRQFIPMEYRQLRREHIQKQ